MKAKVTKKEMKNRYNTIVSFGADDAQYLLRFESPIAYSTRTEGWACDYYDINGILISTGYSTLTEKNSKCNYEIIHKYDDMARNIINNYDIAYEEQNKQVKGLLEEFITEVTNY